MSTTHEQRRSYCLGTNRIRPPEETLELVRPHLARAGITRIAVVTGLDVVGIPVVMVTRPGGRSLSVSQGKGPTLAAAKASGVMEALEHHLAEHIELPMLYMSEAELARNRAVVATQRLQASDLEVTADGPGLWIEGKSLHDGSAVWLPHDLVHLDHRLPLPPGSGRYLNSSNGLASGNSYPEALSHALFELIERHQVAEFYSLPFDEQATRRIDPTTVDDPLCQALHDRLTAAGLQVGVWDATGALKVPCFICDVTDVRRDEFRLLPRAQGQGCHSDKAIALSRALCEAAQLRATTIAGSRDDMRPSVLDAALTAQKWELACEQLRDRDTWASYRNVPSHSFETFAAEQASVLDLLVAAGFGQAVAVDLSKPDFPIHVVRAVVPGLRVER